MRHPFFILVGRPITTTTQNPIKALLVQGPTRIEELANTARKLGRGGAADKLEQLADLARLRSAVGGSGAGDSGGGLAQILGGGVGSSSQTDNGQAGSDDGPQLPEGNHRLQFVNFIPIFRKSNEQHYSMIESLIGLTNCRCKPFTNTTSHLC